MNDQQGTPTKDPRPIHTTFKDNIENLSDSFLLQLEDIRRRRPDRYNHQILGGWLDKAEGVVFSNWKVGVLAMSRRAPLSCIWGSLSSRAAAWPAEKATKNRS